MRFLEYMGFVLAVFPLKYGFIIVQIAIYSCNIPHTVSESDDGSTAKQYEVMDKLDTPIGK